MNCRVARMSRVLLAGLGVCVWLVGAGVGRAEKPVPAPTVETKKSAGDVSLTHEVNAAIDRGLDWLAKQQKPDGCWSNGDFPALTGLSLWSFALSAHPQKEQVSKKAVAFIRSFVQPDGGIYKNLKDRKGGGMSNYNTALCMIALHALNDPELTPIVLKARTFIATGQHLTNDIYYGGMGYDRSTTRAYADLNNSIFAYEAMRLTESAEAFRKAGEPKVDLNWDAAAQFVARCQNKKEDGPDHAGGFFYRPDEGKAGVVTNADGRVVFRPQGSMTYAGLLSLRYAHVPREDARVQAAVDWAKAHWTLDENTNSKQEGLYSYYHMLSRAIVVYGGADSKIPLGDNLFINGRTELQKKLVSIQKIESGTGAGYWFNEQGRYWESDPVLSTAYALISLEILSGK